MRLSRLGTLALLAALVTAPALAQAPAPSGAAKPAATSPAKPAAPTSAAAAASKPALIDINAATREELDALPQIGSARAEAIVKGRPYKSKDELRQKKIIPDNVYNAIKDRIIAHQKS
jgi:competence protein ComEA